LAFTTVTDDNNGQNGNLNYRMKITPGPLLFSGPYPSHGVYLKGLDLFLQGKHFVMDGKIS